MNVLTFPTSPISESKRSISTSARIVEENGFDCLNLYIGNSIYVKDLFMKDVEQSFSKQKEIWLSETKYLSSISEIVNNKAHQEIISMGNIAIPLIFKDLRESNNFWFYALKELTGENPVRPEHRGIIPAMKEDWLKWEEENF